MPLKTRFITIKFEVLLDVTPEDIHEDLCLVYHEGCTCSDKIMDSLVDVQIIEGPVRHVEDKLGGVIEAALGYAVDSEAWLMSMASDIAIDHNSLTDVFQAVESYLTEHLARIT